MMDNERQPAVRSNLMAATISDSSLNCVNSNPGSSILAKVATMANQVNVKIRQKYPEYFRLLPIVVIRRDEFSMAYDKLSSVSNAPSSSSIQLNNDLTNCMKRPLLNESFNIENIKKCRLAENNIEGQSNISNLKSDLHNGKYKNDKIIPRIKVMNENNSDHKSLTENVVFKDMNVKIEMNKNVKKKVSCESDALNSETFGSYMELLNNKRVEINAEIGNNNIERNELPITVTGKGMSKSKTKFPIFKLLDDESKGELIQGIYNSGKIYSSELEKILENGVTFEEFEKQVEKNISRFMHKEFHEQLKSCTDNFIQRKNIVLQEKYDSIKLHLSHLNAAIDRHNEDLKTNINAKPQKILCHKKIQTKIFKNKGPLSFGQCIPKKLQIPAPTLKISDDSTSREINQGTQTPNILYNPPTKLVNLVSPEPNKKSNINVPVQHNIAPLPSTPNQKSLPSWKPLPPAPKLKILNSQTSEDIELILDMETSGFAKIKSFEIYCYNELYSKIPTSVDTWQKVGDVKFIPLPIKCNLKKGTRNIKCYYIVRAVDVHNRVGPFNSPESVIVD